MVSLNLAVRLTQTSHGTLVKAMTSDIHNTGVMISAAIGVVRLLVPVPDCC